MSARPPTLLTLLAMALALAGCGSGNDGPLPVAFIDSEEDLFASGLRLSYGGQVVRAATGAGLVALDAQGEVVPALADRWIVADEGRSYIFRLRDGEWPDGAELTGESARDSLRRAIGQLRGTSLGLDLAPISEVRAMAGRVVEIRLTTPMPDFLRLLAQPELALSHGGFPSGPMTLEREGGEAERGGVAVLAFRPPEARGLPAEADWQEHVRPLAISALDVRAALAAFEAGEVEVVLGGRLGGWPLADPGPLSRGTRRLDAAIGLFGLQVRRESGFLERVENREALAMAIDRTALLAPFNIGGWQPTTRIVPAAIAGERADERWAGIEIDSLRAEARRRVQAWTARNGEPPVLTVGVADQPGNAGLFNELAGQWAEIGVTLRRVDEGEGDLILVDAVARYAEPRWFLNQFHCSLRRGACVAEADEEVRTALAATDAEVRAGSIARAEAMLTAANIYIPLAMPLRWSLVRGDVPGYSPNPWAWHPLPDMATIPR
ncbi:MAG: ABC transporter substrate-binding protein [Croceibacterium sp.]